VYTVTTAINGLFIPKVARLYGEKNSDEKISQLTVTIGRYQFALEGLIVVGFTILGKDFIELWMGEEYVDAYYGLLLVVIPGLFYNALQIAQTAVIMKNYMKYNAGISVVTGVINVIFSLIFSRLWGAVGACVSICIAYTFRAIAFNIFYQKKMNLDMVSIVKKCYIRLTIPMLLSIAVGFLAVSIIPLGGWMGLVVKGVTVSLLYGILLILIGFDNQKELLSRFRSLLPKH
jgi:O-antigen/teichoic acid export membrane protein